MGVACYRTSSLVCDKMTLFLCFVDRTSLYNVVNKANLVHNLFLVYLLIYMFQATMCPSSGETAVFM